MSINKRNEELQARRKSESTREFNVSWLNQQAPYLTTFLTQPLQDGFSDKCGTLLVFAEDGRIKVLINDRGLARKVFLSFHAIEEDFWSQIEEHLQSDLTDWKYDEMRHHRA